MVQDLGLLVLQGPGGQGVARPGAEMDSSAETPAEFACPLSVPVTHNISLLHIRQAGRTVKHAANPTVLAMRLFVPTFGGRK